MKAIYIDPKELQLDCSHVSDTQSNNPYYSVRMQIPHENYFYGIVRSFSCRKDEMIYYTLKELFAARYTRDVKVLYTRYWRGPFWLL